MNKINKDWKEVKLGDIVDITMGQSPKSEFYNKRNEGMPFLQGSATFGFMHPYFETYSSDIKKIAINGSVLMSVRAPVGDLNIANADVCIGRGLCSINGKSNIINRYIFYLLSYYKPKLLNMQKGTTFGAITKDDILNFKVLIAEDIEEQKRIASALSKIDAYLENTIKLIEEKERFKRGIAKKLLTCKEGENVPEARFKGFEDEWEIVKLGDIGTITATGVDKKINDNETPIKLLNYLDVFNRNKLYEKEISYMTTATEKQLEKCNIRKGDLFITPSSEDKKGIAKSSVAMEDFKNTVYSYHIIRVRFNKEIDLKFKSYMCDTDFFHRQAYRLCGGSGQRYFIKLDNFRNMEICIPKSIEEQEKIGGYLSLLDAEIDNLKKQKELIKEMKRGAMQKLLSGEVRLLE